MCVHSYSLRIESMLLKEEFPAVSEAMKSNISVLQTAARGNNTAAFSVCVHACVKFHPQPLEKLQSLLEMFHQKWHFCHFEKKDYGVFSCCLFLQSLRVIQHWVVTRFQKMVRQDFIVMYCWWEAITEKSQFLQNSPLPVFSNNNVTHPVRKQK